MAVKVYIDTKERVKELELNINGNRFTSSRGKWLFEEWVNYGKEGMWNIGLISIIENFESEAKKKVTFVFIFYFPP